MSNIKKYEIECGVYGWIDIEIDHDIVTEEELKSINQFWGGAERRVENNGSVLNAVLKLLAATALQISVAYEYNTYGVVKQFDWNDGGGVEGWPPMDGSAGFKIVYAETNLFDHDDMYIRKT